METKTERNKRKNKRRRRFYKKLRQVGSLVLLTCFIISLLSVITANRFKKLTVRNETIGCYESNLWNPIISEQVNQNPIELYLDGQLLSAPIFMNESMELMVPINLISRCFNCAADFYQNVELVMQKKDTILRFRADEPNRYYINDEVMEIESGLFEKEGVYYMPVSILAQYFGYEYQWKADENAAYLTESWKDALLPASYNLQSRGRSTVVKNQGNAGTCWAVASLSALESSLRPEEELLFSAEHMAIKNSFSRDLDEGGEYTMSMAYLLSWQGPVLEEQDPYGDRQSPDGLSAVRHVQEIQVLKEKDIEKIKKAVFKNGAVQTSIYTSLKSSSSRSVYYNKEKSAFCYIGTQKPNHDIIIIGWDDNYPKENFNIDLQNDGAFICQNSWGSNFGENGIFYVSYYDSNIGNHSVAYTRVDGTDNYQHLYQTDLCGWTGQIGYNKDTAYFANVFTTENRENVKAVGFYATGANTAYEIYKIPFFEDASLMLQNAQILSSGSFEHAGFYTVDLQEDFIVEGGQRFAILIKLTTPEAVHPIAVEYYVKNKAESVELGDGEGYISSNGTAWSNVETEYNCNVCMKLYTDDAQ